MLAPTLALVPLSHQAMGVRHSRVVSMSAEADDKAMVAVNEESIKNAASVSTGVAGLIIGGPVLAVISAVAGNYISQQESEAGEVARGLGKVTLDVINFVLKVNAKYALTDKASDAASGAVASLKEKDSDGTISKVEGFVGEASSKIGSLNAEYDLVEKGKQALSYAADLSNKAIDKGIELNEEYKITDKVTTNVKSALEKGVDAAKKST